MARPALETAHEHYVSRFANFAREAGARDPAWLRSLRERAMASFAEQGFPTTRLEEWRYTSLRGLAKIPFELGPEGHEFELGPEGHEGTKRERVEALSHPLFACSLFVFVNGRHAPELSTPGSAASSLHVQSLAAQRKAGDTDLEAKLAGFSGPDTLKQHPFAALNTAFLDDGAIITAPRGEAIASPIHLVFISAGGVISHPRVSIVAEATSEVTVIQDHVSLDDEAGFTNAVTELNAGPDATVKLILFQRENESGFHISNLRVRQERGSRVSASTLTLGGGLVRNDLEAVLAAEGASCRLEGLYLGGGTQHIDNHTTIDHALPHCESAQLYKGVLDGRSRGVFRGRVVVRPDAQKTFAEQSNPNLLISPKAEVNTKPQLEIHADDVRCSHGSTIGQLDEEADFYLRARGIGADQARDMLTQGFANEITAHLPVPALGERVRELISGRLHPEQGSGDLL
ncbi:MAG: Fe-S cluster assembly protein SufD [Deltaproteobacteria bacterium]|nr:Fe-S cluster assembly protein SufD [Deltaproteobacteria bacterium]